MAQTAEFLEIRGTIMARKCKLTGKGPLSGNNVSFSQKKTKRRFLPNIQTKRIYVAELDRHVRIKMSVRAMRTVDKIGLMPYLKKQGLTLKDVTS
ncbi:50S ribosomal protein L28 [Candidatus Leptofilum sp.]|uniref:50S ribosomal protein L28 n=1 Tax=Candidatus Leptofilum sp. TaxID=3241576 RepID=UPI003B5CCF67